VAERKNRTVMNMVRAMLSEKKIPKYFWPEAVQWSVYVLNRCPTLAVKDTTPEEAWTGAKPSVEHFRIFGCLAHVHVPEAKRIKLDNRSFTCVLLGVSEESKGYRLYDPIAQKIIISRDVIFEEGTRWNWDASYEDQIQQRLEWGDIDEVEIDEEENSDSGANDSDGGSAESDAVDEDLMASDTNNDAITGNEVAVTGEAEAAADAAVIGDEDVVIAAEAELMNDTSNAAEGIMVSDTSIAEGSITRSSSRLQQKPRWMSDYVCSHQRYEEENEINMAVMQGADPINYEDAVASSRWRKAMDSEINSIEKNQTWTLTDLPAGAKKIGVKWLYKTKLNELGEVDKYKARLVAKGYSQQYGVDYTEVFAPVARMDTVRMIVALAAQRKWKIYQLDVKSAFLHGKLSENVFVEQPKGYEKKGSEGKVYQLHKALYGLKQAPRAWFSRIAAYFKDEGFETCPNEHTLFIKKGAEGKMIIVSIYVDDLIYTGNDEDMMNGFKSSMMNVFDMTDMGKMRFFLGIEVIQKANGNFICQKKYAIEVLKRFGMAESNPVSSPIVPGVKLNKDDQGVQVDESYYKQIVGSLMYLTTTRPDMMFSVSLISRFMSRPTELHLQAAKRILRYLQGTTNFGILYKRDGMDELRAFTDSDYAGDVEDRKSTSGYVFLMSSGAVSWLSKKQPIVTLSTTEAEFVAAAGCASQAVWMRRVLENLGLAQKECTTIWCDNSSTIKLSKNPVMHGRSKHIDVRFHFLRDLVNDGIIQLLHCRTQEQIADLMTKALKVETFQKLREELGVCKIE
jgi:hypothetical protein